MVPAVEPEYHFIAPQISLDYKSFMTAKGKS